MGHPEFLSHPAFPLFQGEGLGLDRAVALPEQNLYFAFRAVQLLLALRREAHALLKHLDRVLKREITALELGHDGFELFERLFKRCQRRTSQA